MKNLPPAFAKVRLVSVSLEERKENQKETILYALFGLKGKTPKNV